jgi:hypothetical protein
LKVEQWRKNRWWKKMAAKKNIFFVSVIKYSIK